MDWQLAIRRNHAALAKVVGALLAMAGLQLAPRSADAATPTLPRRLHRAVLRLLRPAEAAARRLVVLAARLVTAPPPRARPAAIIAGRSAFLSRPGGTGILLPPGIRPPDAIPRPPLRTLALPLADRLNPPRPPRRRQLCVPRILAPGIAAPFPVDTRPRLPSDPIDAGRLALRLGALVRVLDDLPAAALRLARWRARRDRALRHGHHARLSPLRPGRPPGTTREPAQAVHILLEELHGLAAWALQSPDTS